MASCGRKQCEGGLEILKQDFIALYWLHSNRTSCTEPAYPSWKLKALRQRFLLSSVLSQTSELTFR